MRLLMLVPLAAMAAACNSQDTDFNEAASTYEGVNSITGGLLDEADRRAAEDFARETYNESGLPATTAVTYACADGSSFPVRFDNRVGTATITLPDATEAVLYQQRTASGIWYRSSAMAIRGKGNEATISRDGAADLTCSTAA